MSTQYFEARERALLGDAYDAYYSAPPQVCRGLTVNTLRCTPQVFASLAPDAYALAPSPFCKEGFLLQNESARPGHSAYHHAGVFYVQEPSASCAAPMLCVQPGERVLDVCAAPGGKTAQLAAALKGKGLLVANEYVAARAAVLRGNLERLGVQNAIVCNEDTARLAKAFPLMFDKVLVDAPCSGEGMFRKEPEAKRQHSEALVMQCAALGREVLDNAAACVAPGGLLAYATCTFAPQENEMQIGAFLQRHPDFVLLPAFVQAGCPGEQTRAGEFHFMAAHTRRIYPCHGGEGHFMALLCRTGSRDTETPIKTLRTKAAPPEFVSFLREYFPDHATQWEKTGVWMAGDVISLATQGMPDVEKARLRVLQIGVQAGTVTKGRFVPAHHLFMAYGDRCANAERLTADDPRVSAWLRGEEIEAKTAVQGYAAVLCDGFPLGFGKQTGGRLKNHYPKGLRNLK